jgi:anti-sigma-K factor RskA
MPAATATTSASAQLAALTPAELRDKLLAAEGTALAEWTPTKDPLGKAATGEVVWNKDQQKGTMRFRGLAKNDPSRAQYQLWIFDKTRDDKYPVDGGVFDVDSETGDVIVPIHATLAVNAPVMFAVTLEKPGGVVVSKRDRIVVTAKLPAG